MSTTSRWRVATSACCLRKILQIEILDECRNGREAVRAINTLSPDLIFLDIQMPEIDGFDVLARVGPERIQAIIFVTAFDQYALKAFDVHALDYLLKPFDDERFADALRRAKAHIEAREIDSLSKRLLALLEDRESERKSSILQQNYLTTVDDQSLWTGVLLKVDEIDFIEADGNYVKLHVGRKTHLLREKMHDLEDQLDPAKVCSHSSLGHRKSRPDQGDAAALQWRLHCGARRWHATASQPQPPRESRSED